MQKQTLMDFEITHPEMEDENDNPLPESSTKSFQDRLKEVLEYDPDTGDFRWKIDRRGVAKAGNIAGSWDVSKQYWMITVFGVRYPAHTLAWFYVHGEWIRPDHEDRNRLNNKINNLRPANRSQNAANQDVRCTNLLGVKGVQARNGKFRAYITVNYKTIHLGTFSTLGEAINARQAAAKEYFGQFSNG